jgi:prepilin-type N-terminal cleavage/methylation domain-containing protein
MSPKNYLQKDSGFTLVELAIVLMIIGLLIGGILRGQEMLINARITSTIQQVKGYEGATVTFKDAYTALPGDISNASTRLAGCETGNTNNCTNGNGDSFVGMSNDQLQTLQIGAAAPKVETTLFWKHLALAHLITGINAGANPASPQWGQTHPAAKLRGGFNVLYMTGSVMSGNFFEGGHYLRLQMPITGNSAFADTTACAANSGPCAPTEAVSPKEAWQIDRKMDDGVPDHGSVLADDRGGGTSGCEGNKYDASQDTALCILYFRIH